MFERAAKHRLTIVGLDAQISATATYAQRTVPGELAAQLAPARRAVCEPEVQRFSTWGYTDAAPLDDAARARLGGCLDEIIAATGEDRPGISELHAMAQALGSALAQMNATPPDDFNLRDAAMMRALEWHLARAKTKPRVIVWCANIHAAKYTAEVGGKGDLVSLGSLIEAKFGTGAAAIGFSASGGTHGRLNARPSTFEAPPVGSLEYVASVGSNRDLAYLDAARLAALGPVASRLIGGSFIVASWRRMFDGIVVIRDEHHL